MSISIPPGTSGEPPAGRRIFRAFRWLILSLALLIVGGLLYLNLVGLPEFIKRSIEQQLSARNLHLNLGRLRLRGPGTVLIENTRLGQPANNPLLVIDSARLQLDPWSLWRFGIQPRTLSIHQAHLEIPFLKTNEPPIQLHIQKVSAQLQITPEGTWNLDYLHGSFAGIELKLSAHLTNAIALRQWLKTRPPGRPTADWQTRFYKMARELQALQLASPAFIHLHLAGDGADLQSFQATLKSEIAAASHPHGSLRQLAASARLHGQATNQLNTQLELSALSVASAWASLDELQLDLQSSHLSLIPQDLQLKLHAAKLYSKTNRIEKIDLAAHSKQTTGANFKSSLTLQIAESEIERTSSTNLQFNLNLDHSLSPRDPASGSWTASASNLHGPWGASSRIELSGQAAHSHPTNSVANADWSFWRFLEPLQLTFNGRSSALESRGTTIDQLQLLGEWRAPHLILSNLNASLYSGSFDSTARLNVQTRELSAKANFDFDPHQIAPLLTTNSQRWLRQFTWTPPPKVIAETRLVLPQWTNPAPNWRKDVLPTVQIAGSFQGQQGSFRKVPVLSASSDFFMTNLLWRLPNLTVHRPEGSAQCDYIWHMSTQEYTWEIQSQVDPKALRPILEPPQQKVLDDFQFALPPSLNAQIRGRWHKRDETGFSATIAATNLSYRGELCASLHTTALYTNFFILFQDLHALAADQGQVTANTVAVDIRNRHLLVTNGLSTIDPDRVVKLIGPRTRAAIKPYRFATPPTVLVNGRFPLHREAKADVHFKVAGHDFQYWKLQAPAVSSDLHWKADTLLVTNLQASFYNGHLAFQGMFDFTARHGADFSFRSSVTNANLRPLMGDITGKTNHMEGLLTGDFHMQSANSTDPLSWKGVGNAQLSDGFLWNIPIFGLFSPILDQIAPGFGNSRISSGTAKFKIDNGVIHTSDLELRSPTVRLQYIGTVDFESRVNARVQAVVLRDTWAVGRVVSLALWPLTKIFEFKITGTLYQPQSEPLYIPKVFRWPFQPFRTMKQIFEPPTPPEPDIP